jgi:hypothetical protein
MRLNPLLAALPALLLAAGLRAQSAHWEPAGGTLPVGQVTALQLVFQDCEPKETPAPPKADGLTLEFTGQASNISWINGDYSRSVTYTYAALLAKKQGLDLPAFAVETNKGAVHVPAAHFEPTGATVGSTGQALESAANSHVEANPASVWAGEVFALSYRVDVARSYYPDFGHGDFAWNPAPLIAEDWDHPEPYNVTVGGEVRTGFVYHTRAVARTAARLPLSPINQLVNLSVGVTGFGFFQQRQYQQFSVTSNIPAIEVRPLPPAPPGFTGAVGEFKLASKVVPTSTTVGEPITWTLELTGTGNWPDISGLPAREVSRDFQVVQPKAKRTPAEGKLFNASLAEDVVLVPTAPGTYPLESFHFVYFDPRSGTYQTLTAPRTTVTVTAPPAAAQPGGGAGLAGPPAPGPAAAPEAAAPPAIPVTPNGLPRDPLPGPGAGGPPWTADLFLPILLLPFLLLALVWIGHAWRRACATDPRRERREAHRRLAALLPQLPGGATPAQLLAWQRDAALLWEVAEAAPSAQAFADPTWAALWSDVDRALYGPAAGLPSDWETRATAALGAKPAPAFLRRSLFWRENLLPWLFAVALLLAAGGGVARAADPAAAYRRGEFADAERGWRAAAAQDPTDWTVRHNLSLALAQENRWEEAAAQATAAFVQQPENASVRWQFALACDKAGFVPDPLAGFLVPGPVQDLARLASPPGWQWAGAAAALLCALALGGLLAVGYGVGSVRWGKPAALVLLVAALVLATAAAISWRAFGSAHDERAVIVWRAGTLRSIPTEADTAQKTTPLGAGSVAVADKTFLGWVRLSFDNGQTGWVRKDEIVGIWK